MIESGYRGERRGFDQRTVSYMLTTPDVAVSGAFFRHAASVLDLNDDQLLELLLAYVRSG